MAAKPAPTPGYPPNYDEIPNLRLPDGLELLSAHWFFRHGERTPVRKRLVHLGIPERFSLCGAGREFGAGVINDGGRQSTQLLLLRRRLESTCGTNSVRTGDVNECYFGELTNLGRTSTLRLGQQLRELYVNRLQFLPASLQTEDVELFHFRSTAVPRAQESLQQCIQGLIPKQTSAFTPETSCRSINEESLYPNTGSCSTLRLLDQQGKKRAAQQYDEATLAPLDASVGKTVGVPIRIGSHPSANGVFDTIKSCQAHGIGVPAIFSDSTVSSTMENAIVYEWFNAYSSRQFAQLAMGRLWGDLLERFRARVRDPSAKLKLALYGCHDTTLGGMLKSLGCYDDKWPAFTSYISVELFKREVPSTKPTSSKGWLHSVGIGHRPQTVSDDDAFVRLRYNSQDVRIPGCAAPGDHLEGSDGTVCTLAAFQAALRSVTMTNETWERECREPPLQNLLP